MANIYKSLFIQLTFDTEMIILMPITVADTGEEMIVRKVGGNSEVKLHLENLGIVPGGFVTLIAVNNGNVILKVKESRIALNKDMAMKIMV